MGHHHSDNRGLRSRSRSRAAHRHRPHLRRNDAKGSWRPHNRRQTLSNALGSCSEKPRGTRPQGQRTFRARRCSRRNAGPILVHIPRSARARGAARTNALGRSTISNPRGCSDPHSPSPGRGPLEGRVRSPGARANSAAHHRRREHRRRPLNVTWGGISAAPNLSCRPKPAVRGTYQSSHCA
jgi:hypothetical protein